MDGSSAISLGTNVMKEMMFVFMNGKEIARHPGWHGWHGGTGWESDLQALSDLQVHDEFYKCQQKLPVLG